LVDRRKAMLPRVLPHDDLGLQHARLWKGVVPKAAKNSQASLDGQLS
jgi:hypothetical protein